MEPLPRRTLLLEREQEKVDLFQYAVLVGDKWFDCPARGV